MPLHCLHHATCEHDLPTCQCFCCWTHEAQCSYAYEQDDDRTNSIQLARPNLREKRLSIDSSLQNGEPDSDSTQTIHHSHGTPSRCASNNSEPKKNIECNNQSIPQLSTSTRTINQPDIDLPTDNGQRGGEPIPEPNEHIQPENTQRAHHERDGESTPRLRTHDNMDNPRSENVPNTGLQDTHHKGRHSHDNDLPKSTGNKRHYSAITQLRGNDDENTPRSDQQRHSSGTTSPTSAEKSENSRPFFFPTQEEEAGPSKRWRGSSPSRSSGDDGIPDKETQDGRSYYTFILHKKNYESENFRYRASIKKGQKPNFIYFDHGDHIHILYASSVNSGNISKQRRRIATFLGANPAGSAESAITTFPVKLLRNFIIYLLRYGIETYHRFGTQSHETLNAVINLIEKLSGTIDIIQDARCEAYIEQKKYAKDINKRIGHLKRENVVDLIVDLAEQHQLTTFSQWNLTIPEETKMQILREYGPQSNQYIQIILRSRKNERIKIKRNQTLSESLLMQLEALPDDVNILDNDAFQAYEWLKELFEANDINVIEFLAWAEAIKAKRFKKINGLCITGPTNAGKSLLAEALIQHLHPEEIPRERENSGFALDQLPEASAVLFEEPCITPTNCGTWKLLLEGKTVKTDVKNKDKEPIKRVPVFITTARDLCSNVDDYEGIQIKQRVKNFNFLLSIDHRKETNVTNYSGALIRKAPCIITTEHIAILYFLHYDEIVAKLEDITEENQINHNCLHYPTDYQERACQYQTRLQEEKGHLLQLRDRKHHTAEEWEI